MRQLGRWIAALALLGTWTFNAQAQLAAPQAAPPTAPQAGPQPAGPQPVGALPAGAQPLAPVVQAPFLLTPEQEQFLDQILTIWERESDKIQLFKSEFILREYDANWGPARVPRRLCLGEVRYSKPDKGYYEITQIQNPIPNPDPAAQNDPDPGKKFIFQPSIETGEKWICDGKSIYEFNAVKKQVIERRLPPELMGKAISDGPLPFVFGIEAAKLKKRYWLRIITPAGEQTTTWVEAFPKFRADAANYQRIQIILRNQDLMPQAVQVFLPNNSEQKLVCNSYVFKDPQANGVLNTITDWWGFFVRPNKPLGWEWIVDDPSVAQGQPQPAVPPESLPRPSGTGRLPIPFVPRR